jgi:hypothetical protein
MEKGPAMNGEWRNRRGEDRQNCKNKNKKHETNREKQYREILKQIQGNPAKTKYK